MTFRTHTKSVAAPLERGPPSPLIQVLVGPRQVGKATAIRQVLKDRGVYFTADSPVPPGTEEIEKVWQQVLKMPNPILAIDEIQKISGWSEMIKKLWDTRAKPVVLGPAGEKWAVEVKLTPPSDD